MIPEINCLFSVSKIEWTTCRFVFRIEKIAHDNDQLLTDLFGTSENQRVRRRRHQKYADEFIAL